MSATAGSLQATVIPDYHTAATFLIERFSPVLLGQTDRMKVVLTCFEPGQFIPVHSPGVDMALIVLEGTGTVVAGDLETEVGPGAIVIVPGGSARGVRATTRLVAAHIVSPPPTEADHAAVHEKLGQGSWR